MHFSGTATSSTEPMVFTDKQELETFMDVSL
jgi:hypothetical protein